MQYYMSKRLHVSPLAPVIAPSPGMLSFAVNRLWRWGKSATAPSTPACGSRPPTPPEKPSIEIEKVVLVRKTTELASLLERREEVLRRLEHAHIKVSNCSFFLEHHHRTHVFWGHTSVCGPDNTRPPRHFIKSPDSLLLAGTPARVIRPMIAM